MIKKLTAIVLLLLASAGSSVADPNEGGPLPWSKAVALALENNRALAAARMEVGVRDAEALQAGLRPNPVAAFEAEDIGGTGDRSGIESGEITNSISQLFELASKRSKRRLVAEMERDVASAAYRVRRRELIVEVTKAFGEVLLKQRRLALASDLLGVAQAAVKTVAATVKSGAVSPVEQDRAMAAVARARADVALAEGELAVARTALAATWSGGSVHFSRVEGALEPLQPPPPLQSLIDLSDSSPEIARFGAEASQRGAALELEQAKAVPDLTVSAGTRQYQDGRDFAFVLGVSVPIPLFDRNQGNVLAAARRITQTFEERQAARNTAQAQLRQAHETMAASFERARTLREDAIPAAEKAYAGARDAYARGLFRYIEVLDAQRTVAEVRSSHVDALESYYDAAAELARWDADDPEPAPGVEE